MESDRGQQNTDTPLLFSLWIETRNVVGNSPRNRASLEEASAMLRKAGNLGIPAEDYYQKFAELLVNAGPPHTQQLATRQQLVA